MSSFKEEMQKRLNVLSDIWYIIRYRRMAKRIQSGESINKGAIKDAIRQLIKLPGLTREQVKAVRDYYYPYKVSTLNHREKTFITGRFSPSYMPSEIYYAYIDPYFNDKKKDPGLENKCLFPRLFPGITQPEMIAFRMNGVWLDRENRMVSFDEVLNAVDKQQEIFVKRADDSFGGFGVVRLPKRNSASLGEQLKEILEGKRGDVIIETALRQHEELARINPHSVNTIRVYSLLMPDEVRIVAGLIRFASDEKSVDNFSSGGMMCTVDSTGRLYETAYRHNGERASVHPLTRVRFADIRVPSYDRVLELVKKAHPMLPFFRFVGWDVAIREDGEPVLIEANLCTASLDVLQLAADPIFGDDMMKIIDEVLEGTDFPKYHGKRRRS